MRNLFSYSNIGLLIDIIGVIIIYFFGISSELNKSGTGGLILEDSDKTKKKAIIYDCISKGGLLLIGVGFIFQIVGNVIK